MAESDELHIVVYSYPYVVVILISSCIAIADIGLLSWYVTYTKVNSAS